MENELRKIHARINELNKGINNVSQYALVISERLTAHDQKLDAILNKLFPEPSKTNSFAPRKVSNMDNPLSKNGDDFSVESHEKPSSQGEDSSTETKSLKLNDCKNEVANKRSFTANALLPFNLSTPSVPQLQAKNNNSKLKKIRPCKSNPALSWNTFTELDVEKEAKTIDVKASDSKREGDPKSDTIARSSPEKRENANLPVNDADDKCQMKMTRSESDHLESSRHSDVVSLEVNMLNPDRNLGVNRVNQHGAVADKKRSHSTCVSPNLPVPESHQRRSSYAGMTVNQSKRAQAVTSENAKQENVNILQVSSQEMKQSGNSIVLSSAANRVFDVQRQTSTSSTATSHSGIDVIMGDDSDLENDEFEIKLSEVPKPIFSHRQVTVKKSTYKHFYDLKEPIGGGRFGRVYRCVEKKTGLVLAAKCFLCKKEIAKPLLKAKSLQRAQNLKTKRTQQEPVEKSDVLMEIAIMNQIDHHNIVKLYDAFENDNTMTLILEYLGGGELFERVIADQSQLTELDAVLFMKQIVSAVQYLHKNLILHLDLKPENILCIDRSTHHLKIIDFGLARKHQPRQKLIVQWGTPEFMAPEMLNYGSVSFPSDMWSLGIICYILLSGISPFLGENDKETMDNIVDCEWDFEEEPFEKVSDEAKDFISRLLVEEKSGRMSAAQCLRHEWLATPITSKRRKALMNKSQLKSFMARMQWKASVAALTAANWLKQKVTTVTDNVLSRDTTV